MPPSSAPLRGEMTLGMAAVPALALVAAVPIPASSADHRSGDAGSDHSRQGGDTIADAVEITIPCEVNGTTVGYADDYEESCPSTSPAPDVVYRCIPDQDYNAEIDLLDSLYDTQVFVYDADTDLIACNTDYFGTDQSYHRDVPLEAGVLYYIIVDGDYGCSGDLMLRVGEYVPCDIGCLGELEGEPALEIDYDDDYNAGCVSSPISPPIQNLIGDAGGDMTLCARSGWYRDINGLLEKDIDWFSMMLGNGGSAEITVTQQEPMGILRFSVQDCADTQILD